MFQGSCGAGGRSQHGRGVGDRGSALESQRQAQVFTLTQQNARTPNTIISGTLSICSFEVRVLFDIGETHSFVSSCFALRFTKQLILLESPLCVATFSDEVMFGEYACVDCEVEVQCRKLLGDLVILEIIGFDMILGIDWLSRHHASVDCWNKIVAFKLDEEMKFAFHRNGLSSPLSILSAITRRIVQKGMQGFLAYVQDVSMKVLRME